MPTRNAAPQTRIPPTRNRSRRSTATSNRWRSEPSPENIIDFDELRRARVQRARALQEREMRAAYAAEAVAATGHAGDFESLQRAPRQKADAGRASATSPQPSPGAMSPCHWGLCVLTLLFAIISIPIVYSASTAIALDNHRSTDFFLWRQIGFVAVGLIGLVLMSRLSAKQLRVVVWSLYAVALVGLIATDFTPLGLNMGGVRRWLKLGPIPLQMSEIAKFALIGVLADFWSRASAASQKSMWPWLGAAAISLPLVALVFAQPHLSAALLLFVLPLGIGFYAGVPMSQIAKIVVPLVLLAAVVVGLCRVHQMPLIKPYQQDRIAAHFFSNGADEQGANYQSLQGQRALKQGGVLGAGPGASIYKQGHLPAPHTDFILAVIGEEWGLAGMLVLLTAYGLMIFFCFQIGHSAGSGFEALLCSGVGTLLAVQVICNAGVVTGILPVTGMPLPLLSYGGSGLICTLLGLGLVLSVSRQSGNAAEVAASAAK